MARGRTWILLAIFLVAVAGVLALPGPGSFGGNRSEGPRHPSKSERSALTPRGVIVPRVPATTGEPPAAREESPSE